MRRFPFVLLALLACHSSRSTRARPRFEDYPVAEHYTGPQAPVDLSSDPGAAEYLTVLREGARQPPDFAGHYVVVTWGCGSPCHSFAIVDVMTGRVYMVPFSAMSGADYQLNSSLFVAQEREGVLTQFKLGRGHHTVISGASFPTRATVEFLDSSRATPSERIAVLEAWTKSLHVNVDVRSALTTELLFREDSLLLWLPVQEVLVPSFRNELKRGDLVTLFVGYVGAEGQGSVIDWVFIVNEFEKR